MVTTLKHRKTSEMALFHVCHFKAFLRRTLKVAESVDCSMLYGWQKFGCRRIKGTWPTGVWKRHLRMRNFCIRPRGEVPPDLTPRFGDFVLQLAFGVKWPHSKFGMKPSNPGGVYGPKRCIFPVFVFFSSWPCFTSISLLSWSAYRSKLADWSFPQCFTTLWNIKVIEWKSRDLSVCKDLISANVFLPPRFPPPPPGTQNS